MKLGFCDTHLAILKNGWETLRWNGSDWVRSMDFRDCSKENWVKSFNENWKVLCSAAPTWAVYKTDWRVIWNKLYAPARIIPELDDLPHLKTAVELAVLGIENILGYWSEDAVNVWLETYNPICKPAVRDVLNSLKWIEFNGKRWINPSDIKNLVISTHFKQKYQWELFDLLNKKSFELLS